MSPGKTPWRAVHPLTTDRWDDFAALFGKSGAYAVAERGGRLIEGYPTDTDTEQPAAR